MTMTAFNSYPRAARPAIDKARRIRWTMALIALWALSGLGLSVLVAQAAAPAVSTSGEAPTAAMIRVAQIRDVRLRNAIEVDGTTVTLGHVFVAADGSGELDSLADLPLSAAPAPGQRLYLDAEQLASIARTEGLVWANARGLRRVAVSRASHRIPEREIEREVAAALAAPMGVDDVEVTFSGRPPRFHIALDGEDSIKVALLDLDSDSGRFRVDVRVPADAPDGQARVLAGRAYPMVPVPVLARAISRGDIIRAGDWTWDTRRADRLPGTAILDPKSLTGMAARRPLRTHSTVRTHDIERPALVERGGLVTMVVRRPGLELTALGRSLDDGSLNEIIRLRNTASMRIVEARVIGPGRVEPVIQDVRTAAR